MRSQDRASYEFTDDEYRLAQAGDRATRNRIIEANRGLAVKCATGWARRNPRVQIDDLVQAGCMGLIRAAEKYDVDRGYTFSTYAMYWIRKEVRLEVMDHLSSGRARRSTVENYMTGKLSDSEVGHFEEGTRHHQCIDEPGGGSSGLFHETLDDPHDDCIERAEIRAEFDVMADRMMDVCTEEEFGAMCMRYGVLGESEMSFTQIAEELGLATTGEARDLVQSGLRKSGGMSDV